MQLAMEKFDTAEFFAGAYAKAKACQEKAAEVKKAPKNSLVDLIKMAVLLG